MMSGQAFNALLKTLEEPPTYVIFILATTEYNKLPTTIVSRCQRFDFKRIATDVIVSRLLKMSKTEDIDITEDAARVIARISRGGMRDAISLLELCAGANTLIDDELVFATVGSGSRESAYKIIEAITKEDYSAVYSVIADIVMKSGDISVFWQELIDSYRDIMVVKNSDKAKVYLDLTEVEYATLSSTAERFTMSRLSYHVTVLEKAMEDMQRAFNSKRSIAEIALTRMCNPRLDGSVEALTHRIEELERQISMIKLGVAVPEGVAGKEIPTPSAEKNEERPKPTPAPTTSASSVYGDWGKVIRRIGEIKRPLAAGLASAVAKVSSQNSFVVTLNGFFAKKIAEDPTDYAIIKGVIAEVEGKSKDEIELKIITADNSRLQDPDDIF